MDFLDLDWASEEDAAGVETARQLNLRSNVVNPHGPGGGWPIIRFTGDHAALVALLAAYDPDLKPDEWIGVNG